MNPVKKAVSGSTAKKKKQRSPAANFTLLVIKIITIIVISTACIVTGILGGAVLGFVKSAPAITPEQLQLKNLTTFVYDLKEKEVGQLKGEQNRILVSESQVPQYLKDAFVAIEDERFYDHPGIDLKRMAGAVINLIKPSGSSYGASTITQQVVKNITGETEISIRRKVQEQWRALQLEKDLTKAQILEIYMNLIYMGENCYGVQSAAETYFNKDVKDLTLAECASLAGITNWPVKYDPLTTEGRKNNKKRQEIILKKMLELNFIKADEYEAALKQPLKFNDKGKSATKSISSQSYFVDQVVIDVKKDLMAKYNISEQVALKNIYNNGYKIYTTMDSAAQKAMDDVFINEKNFPVVNKGGEHAQAAMVIIDPRNGQVRALYGGYGPKTTVGLNRASSPLMKRQPGSSLKPVAVYGPAVDQRLITAATVIDDVPVYMNGLSKGLYPQNYEKTFGGLTSIRSAIRDSVNVVAAKVWKDHLGADKSLEYLKKAGINLKKEEDGNVSIAMGGLKYGVNPLQMAASYVPLAHKGIYFTPSTYTRVEDKDGNIILEKEPQSTIVYDEATSYVMTSMMQDVCKYGTASTNGYGQLQKGKMPTAGKTGTTSLNKDKWFVGYSPYYVAATWYGYDHPRTLKSAEYSQALKLWHLVMEKVHENLKPRDFPEPPGIVKKTVCIYSGQTPSKLCSNDPRGNSIKQNEVFIKGTEPSATEDCDVHVLGKVCKDSQDVLKRNLVFGPNCPSTSLIEKVFIQRKQEYKPVKPGDPTPGDLKYELPAGEYCNIHGPGSYQSTDAGQNSNSNDIDHDSVFPLEDLD
ncbi:MAG: PBP1A family penicillin-binding protein [Clostridia bacterium]|nr:PBP1A family penicillin-binding protein [Clostridia bacterium]